MAKNWMAGNGNEWRRTEWQGMGANGKELSVREGKRMARKRMARNGSELTSEEIWSTAEFSERGSVLCWGINDMALRTEKKFVDCR